ncbi:MAG: hypothetical protein ACKVY0_28035 [Prosthecobacter sp.]|uniref:hypothetical protein n=1 Tax=Prosthecobacter sp. TaxID=1965333 RepID=UPI0039021C71
MPRHVPDDFSFLPTVDSTEEDAIEKEALWETGRRQPQPGAVEPEQPVHEESPVVAPTPQAPPRSVQVPQSAKKERIFEADVAEAGRLPKAPAEPGQDGRALWEAFEKEQAAVASPPQEKAVAKPKQPEAPLPVPRAPEAVRLRDEKNSGPVATPAVSFSGRRAQEKAGAPVSPPPMPTGKAKMESLPQAQEPADTLANPKPFIAPKPAPTEPEDPDTAKKTRWRKLAEKVGVSSLGLSVGVHLFLLSIAAFVGVTQVMERQVDFLPGGSSPQSQAAAEELTHKIQQKKNPWLKTKPQMRKLAVQSLTANVVLPEMPPMDMMDFSKINNRMDISKAGVLGASKPLGMGAGGAGGGFGAGIGRGGKFSFVGQTAIGRRVVFVVDVSGSMSAIGQGEKISRFDLLKKELVKSISQIPMGTAYQILFFSDFAWPHNEVDSRKPDALLKYRWEIEPKDFKQVKIPTFKFLQASPFSLQDSREIIERSDNPGGTNWGSGLLMALNASPKPDVIFFMTDGNRSDEMGWIDIITAENKRRAPMTVIHTSAMQQPDAARELDDLARRNNGKFTVVMGEGKVIKGEDFFKMK